MSLLPAFRLRKALLAATMSVGTVSDREMPIPTLLPVKSPLALESRSASWLAVSVILPEVVSVGPAPSSPWVVTFGIETATLGAIAT